MSYLVFGFFLGFVFLVPFCGWAGDIPFLLKSEGLEPKEKISSLGKGELVMEAHSVPKSDMAVRINMEALEGLQVGDEVIIEIGDVQSVAVTESVGRHGTRTSWSGKVSADDMLVLTVMDGALAGSVKIGHRTFVIEPTKIPGKGILVETTNMISVPDMEPEIPPFVPPSNSSPFVVNDLVLAEPSQSQSTSTVDVLALYTPVLKNAYGGESGVRATIQNLIDVANTIHRNSNTGVQFNIVAFVEIATGDDDDMSSTLSKMREGTGEFSGIHSWMDTYGADIATLFRKFSQNDISCGIGYLPNNEAYFVDPGYDFYRKRIFRSIVEVGSRSGGTYCNSDTFAHEVGHNMGCAHDRAHASSGGVYSFSYGYCGSNYGTVMSYCSPRVPYFSDDLVVDGKRIGDANTRNAETIRRTGPYVALTRSSTTITYTLSLSKSGTGSGTVTSSPPGISCGSDCSETYSPNAYVTLTATPATGSTFGGWGGDCSSCGTNTACQIVMTSNKTCTATFNQGPPISATKVAGVGDFNGDGKSDILWRNTSTGMVAMWLMNGTSMTNWGTILGTGNTAWTVAGVGDFNGDHKTDILWCNESTTMVTMWLMDGVSMIGWGIIF